MADFESSPGKDLLRGTVDASYISAYAEEGYDERVYFGLPGEAMLDVVGWREWIDRAVCVDNNPLKLAAMQLLTSAPEMPDCDFLLGDIEDVLIEGQDADGQELPDMPFSVVNLDFHGGLIQEKSAKRLRAIKEVFTRQAPYEVGMVLLLTPGPRWNPGDELRNSFEAIEQQVWEEGFDASTTCVWYLTRPNNFEALKVYVPYHLALDAHEKGFQLDRYGVFRYYGKGRTPMIHFAMAFVYRGEGSDRRRPSPRGFLSAPMTFAAADLTIDPICAPRARRRG